MRQREHAEEDLGSSRAGRQPDMIVNSGRKRTRTGAVYAALSLLAFGGFPELAKAATPTDDQIEFFESRVRPVLSEHCYSCHSSQVEAPFAGLRLDSREAILQGGVSGPAISAGSPGQSRLVSCCAASRC